MKDQLTEKYCYLVSETAGFVEKYFENIVPAGKIDQNVNLWTKDIYIKAEKLIAEGQKEEMEKLLENYLDYSLEYFKNNTTGQTMEVDRRSCCSIILNTVQMVANLSVMLDALDYEPAAKVIDWLKLDKSWQVHCVHSGYEVPERPQLQ